MSYPMLAASSTWYKGTTKRSSITEINIVDSYTVTGNETESWAADVDATGAIMCYVAGTVLTIAGNGSGKIYANVDSSYAFSDSAKKDCYSKLTAINGLTVLDTSKATSLSYVLYYASSLKSIDLSSWDTSNVTNLRGAFTRCTALESVNVRTWNTCHVENMYGVFNKCEALQSLDVSQWDTSVCKDMTAMFYNCFSLTALDVSEWDTSSCENMQQMFTACTSLVQLDVSNWNVSNVKNFVAMFQGGSSNAYDMKLSAIDVSKWDTASATDMNHIFYGCAQLTEIDISNWDVSKVTDMNHMFADCLNLKSVDITKWNTSKVADFHAMFNECRSMTSIDVSGLDTQSAVCFSQLFENCSNLTKIIGLENFNTISLGTDPNWSELFEMFSGCAKLTELDLSSFDTSKVKTNAEKMFLNCASLKTIYVSDKWNLDNVATSTDMFAGCSKLVGGAGTVYSSDHVDATYAKIDSKAGGPGYLTHCLAKETFLVKGSTLLQIADSIRAKTGKSDKLCPADFVTEIDNIVLSQ